jgi:hypothetical protein
MFSVGRRFDLICKEGVDSGSSSGVLVVKVCHLRSDFVFKAQISILASNPYCITSRPSKARSAFFLEKLLLAHDFALDRVL